MGLSASQARLLSITARLSDNELHSQQVANSKLRLADKTQAASADYIKALDTKKLMYTTYDNAGNASRVNLTPALLYTYSDIKNQYGISNTSGQLLVNSTDSANYAKSTTLNKFLECYNIELPDNPEFIDSLSLIYGENYAQFYDIENLKVTDGLNNFSNDTKTWVDTWQENMSVDDYTNWANQVRWTDEIVGQVGGDYKTLIDTLRNFPANLMTPILEIPNISEIAMAYNNSACHNSVAATNMGIWHMEHNLCHLIWGSFTYTEDGESKQVIGFGLNQDGSTKTLTNSSNTITITDVNTSELYNNSITTGFAGSGKDAAGKLLGVLSKESIADLKCIQDIKQKIIDLYCDVVKYEKENPYSNYTPKTGTISATGATKTAEQLMQAWNNIYKEFESINNKVQEEFSSGNVSDDNPVMQQYNAEITHINNAKNWQTTCKKLYETYQDTLKNLPLPKIPDKNDPKTQWYINLWHRLNGESDFKSPEGERGMYYKQLDENLLTSASWLQFALEHGIVSLEKVQMNEGLETKWEKTIYSSCFEITEIEDEVAIAKAEAEYTKKLNEIQAADKKYDNDIKKLDTEHEALKTEYDAVKEVISKNVDRSFKAFS